MKATSRCAKRWGFSFLELMLVLVIIALVSSIAVPRYASALWRYRSEAAAGRLVADLQLAQTKARHSSDSFVVTFNVDTDRLEIIGPLPVNGGGEEVVAYTDYAAEPYHADLVEVTFSGATLLFNGFGRPDQSGTIEVLCGGQTRTISVNAISGQVLGP
jgi:prepilin-type N-terminal cleavage/methylation domain-containing protein